MGFDSFSVFAARQAPQLLPCIDVIRPVCATRPRLSRTICMAGNSALTWNLEAT
jgi:hypothetical protein